MSRSQQPGGVRQTTAILTPKPFQANSVGNCHLVLSYSGEIQILLEFYWRFRKYPNRFNSKVCISAGEVFSFCRHGNNGNSCEFVEITGIARVGAGKSEEKWSKCCFWSQCDKGQIGALSRVTARFHWLPVYLLASRWKIMAEALINLWLRGLFEWELAAPLCLLVHTSRTSSWIQPKTRRSL